MNYNPQLHKLPNGVTVILDPMVGAATTRVVVQFDTGSRTEAPEQSGLLHFCEHMLCKGTKTLPTSDAIETMISNNGGITDATTSVDSVRLYGLIIGENANVLLDNFSDRLQNSLFDNDAIEKERGVILNELLCAKNNQSRLVKNFFDKKVWGGALAPFGTLGKAKNIKSFTREQMLEFLSNRLSGKNCVICVSGRIDSTDKMLAYISDKFSFLPAKDVAADTTDFAYTPTCVNMGAPKMTSTNLQIDAPTQYRIVADNQYERACLRVYLNYLSTELFRVLRTDSGLVYGIDCESEIIGTRLYSTITTNVKTSDLPRCVAMAARTTVATQTTRPITDDYIRQYNNCTRLGDAQWLESNIRRSNSLVQHYSQYGQLYDFNTWCDRYTHMTAADVIAASRGVFNRDLAFMTIGPEHGFDLQKIWNDNFNTRINNKILMAVNQKRAKIR